VLNILHVLMLSARMLDKSEARHLKELLAYAAILVCMVLPAPTLACSAVGCLDRGVEFRRSFTVTVTHQGKPLPRVSVQVTGNSEGGDRQAFSELTRSNGTAHFANLPPGNYWIKADLLGIGAGYECFHIRTSASRKAKKNRRYDWGDDAVSATQAVGRLVDSQPGKGSNALQNLLHRINVPITEAKMELREPVTGTTYTSASDTNGHFAFDHVPNGLYVLHIDAETASENRPFDETNLLVRFSDTAKRSTLLLSRREPGGGSCGGTSLEIEDPQDHQIAPSQ
jgi:hypothetical protein